MRTLKRTVGTLLLAFGAVWFFQGIGVLPGSFMTGQTKWAVIGAVTAVVGSVLIAISRRPRQH